MLTVVLALLAAASNACSSVLQRKANLNEVTAQRTGLASLAHLLRQPLWLAGIAAVILSFLLQAGALTTGELAEVQPLMSLELPMTLLIASKAFGRSLQWRTWADIGVMTGGIALFLIALHPTGGDPQHAGALDWTLGAGVTGVAVVLLTVAAYSASGNRRAALLGVATGTAFALTAVFMSGALADGISTGLFTKWQTYLVGVAGFTAMGLLQEAFRAGSLVAVQPGVTLSDPVVSVILGALLFQEQDRYGGWIIAQVAGALAVGWGAIQLSRSPIAAETQAGEPAETPAESSTADQNVTADQAHPAERAGRASATQASGS